MMEKGNDSKKKVLASLVMGLNCVNSFAPVALVAELPATRIDVNPSKEIAAEPEQYTAACYQALDVVDSAIFGTAEAAFTQSVGTAFATSSVNGETVEVSAGVSVQKISAGGIATDGIISNGARQSIFTGGTGALATMNGGEQVVSSGGTGLVATMNGLNARQFVYSGGTGAIATMNGGLQAVSSGGTGTVTTVENGGQSVDSGGTGTITTLNMGNQRVYSGGTGAIATLNMGFQSVSSGGIGTITTLNVGWQSVDSGGIGTVTTVNADGLQFVYSGGTGTVTTMNYRGSQTVDSGGTGAIATMNGGLQAVSSGGTGTVTTMNSGWQEVSSGGKGTVTTMNYGSQTVDSCGTGTITTMESGYQYVELGGTGIVTTMNDAGFQQVRSGATGTVTTMNNGRQYVSGIGTVTTMNGGFQEIDSGGTGTITTMNSGYQYVYGTGTITTMNGGRQYVVSGGTSLNTTVNGGTVAIFDNTAVVKNTTINAGTIRFNGGGADYRLTGIFQNNGGTVDLTVNANGSTPTTATYETLTIENIVDNRTVFLMDTDLNSETNGDKLVIQTANPNAGGSIQVYDKSLVDGSAVVGPKKLRMVTDNSGVTSWTGKSLDTGGLWTITPTIIKEGNDWYLYLSEKPLLPNEVAQTNIGFANAAYGAWRNAVTDDTLRMRLGDLRYNDAEDGVWVRAKAGKMDASGFAGSYQTYQVGMDKKLANTVYGVAVDHMIGSDDYLTGSGKNSMTNLSLYATNYHPSGVYSDVVVKAGKYRGDLNVNSTNDAADYSAWGYSASYEIGKTIAKENGFFIEPEAQFILGKLQGANYTSNEGISVDRDGFTSFLGRLGFVAGRKLSNAGDYYFKASLWREFAGSGDINISAVNNFGDKERMMESIDHKDTWFELGLGGNVKLAKMTHLYGDVVKTFGADIQKKWQVNAGVRWEF